MALASPRNPHAESERMKRRLAACIALAIAVASAATSVGQAQPLAPSDDPAVIYRYDPLIEKLIAVPAEEITPGFVYYRYHPHLGRRVWSQAVEGGGFEYAMAPGSVQLARALDLRATQQQLREALTSRAPELARVMDIRGALAFVRLLPDGAWDLVRQPTIASVYDLETSRRWEWHGERRVAVVHTGGYEWTLVDGKFHPVTFTVVGAPGCW
jgi:hypothetical protein